MEGRDRKEERKLSVRSRYQGREQGILGGDGGRKRSVVMHCKRRREVRTCVYGRGGNAL